MSLDKAKKVISGITLLSLLGVIHSLMTTSWKYSVLCLLAFCLTSNIYTVITVIERVSKIAGGNMLSELLNGIQEAQ